MILKVHIFFVFYRTEKNLLFYQVANSRQDVISQKKNKIKEDHDGVSYFHIYTQYGCRTKAVEERKQ